MNGFQERKLKRFAVTYLLTSSKLSNKINYKRRQQYSKG